jgi:ribosome-binding protein aMBF1 (putative translation factor)
VSKEVQTEKDVVKRIEEMRYPPHDEASDCWAELAVEAAREIGRLRGDFGRIYQATIDNPEKLTIGDIARIAKENAT